MPIPRPRRLPSFRPAQGLIGLAVALATVGVALAASAPQKRAFTLELRGQVSDRGTVKAKGQLRLTRGRVEQGTFSDGRGAGGTFVSKLGTRTERSARGRGRTQGMVLATFADEDRGSLCIAFSLRYRPGARNGVGTFRVVGGTGDSAKTRAAGTYTRSRRSGGHLLAKALGQARDGKARPLPRRCRDLGRTTATARSAATSTTFLPVADSYVQDLAPNTNSGASTGLRIDGSPVDRTYIRFFPSGLTGTVTRATLRTYVNRWSNTGYTVRPVADTAWGELTITNANAPAMGPVVSSSGPFGAGWTAVDVTPLVTGNGLVSLGLMTASTTSKTFSSRESGANAPQLVVETEPALPPPDTTPPAVTLTQPTSGSTTTDTTPGFAGAAGTAAGDSTSVTVKVYTGTSATGTPVQTLAATASGGSWSVDATAALAAGTYTASAQQSDAAGNTGYSAASTFAVEVQAPPPATSDPILLAAGDIADCNVLGDDATAGILDNEPGTVATLGDNVYENGTAAEFANCYEPTWGRAKARTRPSVGNHEYNTPGASGYFDYFGASAGDPAKGYYSYDLGAWHVVALNSNCWAAGGCGAGSPQEQWLRADLAAHPTSCTLAYWHHPRFSSGHYANDASFEPFWQALYEYGADVVLSGHAHFYERFAPQDATGRGDAARGIREFIVGTGGRSHHAFTSIAANSGARDADTFGLLKLTLRANGYDWKFLPEGGRTFTDAGTDVCDGTYADTAPPTTPTGLAGTASPDGGVKLGWTASTDDDGVAGYRIFRDGAEIGTSRTAVYTDSAVQAGATYSYEVAAYDLAGRTSARSSAATVTTTGANQLRFTPTDDAYVRPDYPTTNYGARTSLQVDNSPVKSFLLKFSVAGVGSRPIVGAKLRLHAVDPSGAGGEFRRVADTTWRESTVTWDTAPAADPAIMSTLGPVATGNWYEADVRSLVTGDGVVSVRVTSPSSDGADYASKEGTAGLAPELVLTLG